MNPFDYNHKPTETMITLMEGMRAKFKDLAQDVMTLPDSREKSLCITKLEEASMWVNKAISNESK